MVMRSLKPFLGSLFKNCIVFLYSYPSPVSVPFFCICTDPLFRYYFSVFILIPCFGTVFLYSYRSSISVPFLCIVLYNNGYLLYYHLTPDTCYHLTPACYHLIFVYYHLSPAMLNTWLMIIILREFYNCYPILYAMICISGTHVLFYS